MIGYLIDIIRQHQQDGKKQEAIKSSSKKATTTIKNMSQNENTLYHDCGTDEGMCLLAFFKFFGQSKNLNLTTTLRVHGAEAHFDKTNLVVTCQQVFSRAYKILLLAINEGPAAILSFHSGGIRSQRTAATPSMLSFLLFNFEEFVSKRNKRSLCCRQSGPLRSDSEKDIIGRAVLQELQQWQHKVKSSSAAVDDLLTGDDIKRIDPYLWEQLRSFPSSHIVGQHLKSNQVKIIQRNAKAQRKEKIAARLAATMSTKKQNIKLSQISKKNNSKIKRKGLDPHGIFNDNDYKDEYNGQKPKKISKGHKTKSVPQKKIKTISKGLGQQKQMNGKKKKNKTNENK